MSIEFEAVGADEAAVRDPFKPKIPWPADTIVVFAKEDGEIVARSALVQWPHIEGTVVAEKKRGSSLALKLLREMESILKSYGRDYVFALAWNQQPEVASYLSRVGYEKMDVELYFRKI